MRSRWDFVHPVPWSQECQDIVFIEDLDGPMSVTNDAENVLSFINQNWPDKRLVYKDTQGEWAELVWSGPYKISVSFKPWHGAVWDRLTRVEHE